MRVHPDLAENLEPLGTKRKYWFREGDTRLLFKAEERGTGEDWAEKIACELCALLGLPHVPYDLAVEIGTEKPGVVCASCAPPPMALVMGNQLLLAHDPAYPAAADNRYKVKAHTVDAVAEAVSGLQPPSPEWMANVPAGVRSALDVFTGYVMLDAWIANQDRHHENWGALREGATRRLAPTFDHGAAMARNLADEERHERLISRDRGRQIPAFVRRARSAFYADADARRPLTTVEAWQAFKAKAPAAAEVWLAQLAVAEDPTIRRLLEEVPPARLSQVGRDFTAGLLAENRRRILENEDE